MNESQNNYADWKQSDQKKKKYILYKPTYIKPWNWQTNLQWQKADQRLPGDGQRGGRVRLQWDAKALWGDDSFQNPYCGGAGVGVHVWEMTKLYTWNMCRLLHVNYVSIKPEKITA